MNVHNIQICSVAYTGVYRNGGYIMRIGIRAHDVAYAQSRIALGAAVVFGMAMNTLLATVYIPNFYELMQKLQEKFSKKKGNNDKQEGSM